MYENLNDPPYPISEMKYKCKIVGGRNKRCSFDDMKNCNHLKDRFQHFVFGVYKVKDSGFNSERDLEKIEKGHLGHKLKTSTCVGEFAYMMATVAKEMAEDLKKINPEEVFLVRLEK